MLRRQHKHSVLHKTPALPSPEQRTLLLITSVMCFSERASTEMAPTAASLSSVSPRSSMDTRLGTQPVLNISSLCMQEVIKQHVCQGQRTVQLCPECRTARVML